MNHPYMTADIPAREHWQSRAACVDTDPEFFFPLPSQLRETQIALAACWRCPSRRECLEEGLAEDLQYGIRGGLTEVQRRELKRHRR